MTDNPPRNGASLLLRSLKIFTPVATGVVLIFIGYVLNSWLSRDHLSIEYVQFVPATQAQVPLTEINRKLHQLGTYPVYQTNAGFTMASPPCNLGNPGAYSNPAITAAAVRSFQNCLERFADNNKLNSESLRKLLSDLDKNPPPATLDTIILSWSGFFDCCRIVSPEQKLQNAKRGVKAAISVSAEIERVSGELLELVKQIKISRTGNVTVVVTIRNTGDTDGLVMAEDFLILNKNPARLPIQPFGTYNPGMYNPAYISPGNVKPNPGAVESVPKRSAVTISFVLDPSLLPEPPRVAISELLKQSQYGDLRGRVILKDTRNSDFESKEFDFPPGPEE